MARQNRIALCRLAAIGHPNRKGAQMYADAISLQLKALISSRGWLRTPNATVAPGTAVP